MNASIVIITGTQTLSAAVKCYLESAWEPKRGCVAWTYGRDGISGVLHRAADLLILSILGRDDVGYRAEGLATAEKMAASRRGVLLISGCAVADRLACLYSWDLAAADTLSERVGKLLTAPPPVPSDSAVLREHFQAYMRPAVDRHRFLRKAH